MKKDYMKPSMKELSLNMHHGLLQDSGVKNVDSDETGIGYGGGGSGPARSNQNNALDDDWDEDWDEDWEE